MRVGCRLAGKVSGVELIDGGVEVVRVEDNPSQNAVVGVGLDDVEHFALNASGPPLRPKGGQG